MDQIGHLGVIGGHCEEEKDQDYPGNELGTIFTADLNSCKTACLNNPQCKGYVMNNNIATCYLKSKMQEPPVSAWNTIAGKCYHDVGPTSGPTPGGSASLSSGSILLIVFFIVSAVYLIIGAAFMKVKRNALGSEVIPNKNFWTDLPGLVMDGVKLIIYPCSKRSNYQNVV